ncbi:MAG: methyl-accepting chemotaxis protein [FCB group bacterium]|jgi:methyl-accepting chemotaxis protein|nr:methyl-accepting chemotaxis protein [FCB group bacterium]
MSKQMKLRTRIALGFGSLLVIAAALGGLAVVSMNQVKVGATNLAKEFVPEVAVATNVERFSLLTMYEMRGYGFTEDQALHEKGMAQLAQVKQFIKDAHTLAAASSSLVVLEEKATAVEKKVAEYEGLVGETVANFAAMDAARKKMDESAAAFMDNALKYFAGQSESLNKDLAGTLDAAALTQRSSKIIMASEVVDLGNATRLAAWKSQAKRDPKVLEEGLANLPKIAEKLDAMLPITVQQVNIDQINATKTAANAYGQAMQELLQAWNKNVELGTARAATAEEVLMLAQDTAKAGMEQTMKVAEESATSLARSSIIVLIGLGCAVVIGILLALFITRSITKPINRIIEGLSLGAEQVTSASQQVAQSSQSMAEGASQQASSLEETSASLEEMASMTSQNAENAGQANGMAKEAQQAAEKGRQAMERMATTIADIKKSSDQTAKILKTIDEIAFQTNLLALNAAVEAARAGEAGKGFAVVAEEVRNLAQRSAEAAKNTATLIEEAQKNADNGVNVSTEVGGILDQIFDRARKVNQLIEEVAAAGTEQARGIEQVNIAVSQMDQVTQANAANSEEAASAAEELSAQAEQMNEMVASLITMVHGTREGAGSSQQVRSQAPAPSRKHAPAKESGQVHRTNGHTNGHANGKTNGHTNGKTNGHSRPEEVIPLDEEEALSSF